MPQGVRILKSKNIIGYLINIRQSRKERERERERERKREREKEREYLLDLNLICGATILGEE